VTDVQTSVAFYSQILDQAPAANYGDFALFPLPGITIALQNKTQINPAPGPAVGGLELCFSQADRATVDRLHAEWAEAGVELALAPAEEDFGYTFVAVDPDGHRLRVCATRASAE
jgi:catechol 2,3-dioxygenase-like lactoylglutathione lyase family enzyme